MWETERNLILSPYFYTLVSAICPINMSSLIQQSKKLDWWCFIACNSFMSTLLMHWDVTAGRLIKLACEGTSGEKSDMKN